MILVKSSLGINESVTAGKSVLWGRDEVAVAVLIGRGGALTGNVTVGWATE